MVGTQTSLYIQLDHALFENQNKKHDDGIRGRVTSGGRSIFRRSSGLWVQQGCRAGIRIFYCYIAYHA